MGYFCAVDFGLSLEVVMFRNCSQPIQKFSLKPSLANQKADMDLQKERSKDLDYKVKGQSECHQKIFP